MPAENICLFDPPHYRELYPLVLTRAVCDVRVGMFTIRNKWERLLQSKPHVQTREYLQPLYGSVPEPGISRLYINGALIPDLELAERILSLAEGQVLVNNDGILAARTVITCGNPESMTSDFRDLNAVSYTGEINLIRKNWDIFLRNGEQIRSDIAMLNVSGNGRSASGAIKVTNPSDIYIEEGAVIEGAIINAENGPVYICSHARIMDGAILRGPIAIGDHSEIKMGAKIYGDTTIGPYCKIGGELVNSVIFGYSNKGHDGFMGNSVVGEWCNFGADTNVSNLKNNYSDVSCWSYSSGRMERTNLQFCGLIMGDHSRTGINTMLNTGTVCGVFSNIFGSNFPPKFIPSFSWGGSEGLEVHDPEKAMEGAGRMMERRGKSLTAQEKSMLKEIYSMTQQYRNNQP